MNKQFVITMIVVVLAAIGVGVWMFDSVEPPAKVEKQRTKKKTRAKIKEAETTKKASKAMERKSRKVPRGKPNVTEVRGEYEGKDMEIAERLQAALDADDFDAVCKAAAEALKSANPELRKEALDALGWFGAKALPELTAAMADPDEDVAQTALSNADTALTDMEDVSAQFDAAAAYMSILSKNEDVLEAFGMTLSTSADALCTPEDEDNAEDVRKAAANRQRVVAQLKEMIGAGGKLSEYAKESYSFVTGHEWISEAEAHRWAADPDNYEEPEESE